MRQKGFFWESRVSHFNLQRNSIRPWIGLKMLTADSHEPFWNLSVLLMQPLAFASYCFISSKTKSISTLKEHLSESGPPGIASRRLCHLRTGGVSASGWIVFGQTYIYVYIYICLIFWRFGAHEPSCVCFAAIPTFFSGVGLDGKKSLSKVNHRMFQRIPHFQRSLPLNPTDLLIHSFWF